MNILMKGEKSGVVAATSKAVRNQTAGAVRNSKPSKESVESLASMDGSEPAGTARTTTSNTVSKVTNGKRKIDVLKTSGIDLCDSSCQSSAPMAAAPVGAKRQRLAGVSLTTTSIAPRAAVRSVASQDRVTVGRKDVEKKRVAMASKHVGLKSSQSASNQTTSVQPRLVSLLPVNDEPQDVVSGEGGGAVENVTGEQEQPKAVTRNNRRANRGTDLMALVESGNNKENEIQSDANQQDGLRTPKKETATPKTSRSGGNKLGGLTPQQVTSSVKRSLSAGHLMVAIVESRVQDAVDQIERLEALHLKLTDAQCAGSFIKDFTAMVAQEGALLAIEAQGLAAKAAADVGKKKKKAPIAAPPLHPHLNATSRASLKVVTSALNVALMNVNGLRTSFPEKAKLRFNISSIWRTKPTDSLETAKRLVFLATKALEEVTIDAGHVCDECDAVWTKLDAADKLLLHNRKVYRYEMFGTPASVKTSSASFIDPTAALMNGDIEELSVCSFCKAINCLCGGGKMD